MASSAYAPLRVPVNFWQRDEVCTALRDRDIGHLFRLLRQYCGASQTRIGAAVGYSQSRVSSIVNGQHAVVAITGLERIADGLDMPDHARMRLGLAPKEENPVKRRTALGLSMAITLTPATLTNVLRESAAEALEFTRERAASSVGKDTLNHLNAVIIDLDQAYPWRPAVELFPVARAYRHRIAQLIDGQHTLREARELYVQASHLSYLLSDLADDLGSLVTAQAWAIDSYQQADEAGDAELCAQAAKAKACVLLQSGAAGNATKTALNGLNRVSQQHPLAAQLRVVAARGYARQGDGAACADLLTETQKVCEHLPDEIASRFSTLGGAEHTLYRVAAQAASCYVALGEWKQAERQARTASGVARWSPGYAACTLLDLGIARAHLGSPDEAAEQGMQALTFGRGFFDLLAKARNLDTALRSRYPNEPGTLDFHDQYLHRWQTGRFTEASPN